MEKILIEFNLIEDVTPDWLAQRVAEACTRYGAIKDGESLHALEGEKIFTTLEMRTALAEYEEIIKDITKGK